MPQVDYTGSSLRHSTEAEPNAERRKGQNHKARGNGVAEDCTVHARMEDVIEKISVAWNDSGEIGMHRRSCGDKTNSHKMTFLVGADTCTGHRKTLVLKRWLEEGEGGVVGCKARDRVAQNPMLRRGRSKLADGLVVGQGVVPKDERRHRRLEKIVSDEETKERT